MSKRFAIPIGVLALLLFSLPLRAATPLLLAQHGGGSRGGGHGGHRGGGPGGFAGGGHQGGHHVGHVGGGHHGGHHGGHIGHGHHRGHGHHGVHWGGSFGWWSPYYFPYYRPYGRYGYYGYYPYGYYRYYPTRDWAAVDTDVSPEEAEVYLDGRYVGIADDFDGRPDYLYLKPGQYRLEFRLEGYEPISIDIQARRGTRLDIDQKLRTIPGAGRYGYSKRRDPEWSVQRFWGKSKDASEPVTRESIYRQQRFSNREDRSGRDDDRERETAAGDTQREGSRPERRAEAGERDDSSSDEQGETRLRLSIDPPDAAVYVDDRFVGTAEEVNSLARGISVSSGKHTVTVLRPGFKEKTLGVNIDEGKIEKLEVSLRP